MSILAPDIELFLAKKLSMPLVNVEAASFVFIYWAGIAIPCTATSLIEALDLLAMISPLNFIYKLTLDGNNTSAGISFTICSLDILLFNISFKKKY